MTSLRYWIVVAVLAGCGCSMPIENTPYVAKRKKDADQQPITRQELKDFVANMEKEMQRQVDRQCGGR